MTTYQITATEMARQLSDILNRTYYQAHSFETKRGNDIIAKLVPGNTAINRDMLVGNLNNFFSNLPHLDEDDSLKFEQEVQELRRRQQMEGEQRTRI